MTDGQLEKNHVEISAGTFLLGVLALLTIVHVQDHLHRQ